MQCQNVTKATRSALIGCMLHFVHGNMVGGPGCQSVFQLQLANFLHELHQVFPVRLGLTTLVPGRHFENIFIVTKISCKMFQVVGHAAKKQNNLAILAVGRLKYCHRCFAR